MPVIDLGNLLPIAHQNFYLEGDDLAVRGMDGNTSVVGIENRMWKGRIDLPELTRPQAMQARALGDRIRGRMNPFRIEVGNPGTPSLSEGPDAFYLASGYTAAEVAAGEGYYDDGLGYTDGTGFAFPAAVEPVVAVAVLAGATVLQATGLMGERLAVGAFFSIGDHLYRVAENVAGRITFNPPLRVAAAANDRIEVTRPTILVRLSDSNGWRVFQQYCHDATPTTINVEEVVTYA